MGQQPLNLNGPATQAAADRAAADGAKADAAAAVGTNKVALTASMQPDGSAAAELLADRKWTNGWDVTLYAKAWWTGATRITKPATAAGLSVTKSFE